ncbi:MAG: transglutaminase-like domain-containing protein [Actinomycetia bacterium]|nr:transglutaminase-like domain-containing protein [Actinomycetes bacterium]
MDGLRRPRRWVNLTWTGGQDNADRGRLRALRQIINLRKTHPTINTFSRRILRQYHVANRDYPAQVRALQSWMQGNIGWILEPGDQFVDPIWTLYNGWGDCDCHSALFGALLESIRIPTNLTILRRNGRGVHVFVKVGFPTHQPRVWIPAETSLIKPLGWSPVNAPRSELRQVV